MALAPCTREAVDGYWASLNGVDREGLSPATPCVVPGSVGTCTLFGFARGGHLLLSVPAPLVDRCAEVCRDWTLETLLDRRRIESALGVRTGAIVGPASLGYLDRTCFRAAPEATAVRRVGLADRRAWERLRDACGKQAWQHGGGELEAPGAGWFEGERLLALGHYVRWGDAIAQVGVVADPTARRRGRGRAVGSAICRMALDAGLIPQWRTLEANAPSLAIARGLGFVPYARTVTVRLG